jgi:hypothetical protein
MAMPAAANTGSLATTKRVSFSDPLVYPPSQQEQPRVRLGTVFLLPRWEVFACPGQAAPSQPPQRGIHNTSRNRLRGSTSDLILFSSEASAQSGALWALPTPLAHC